MPGIDLAMIKGLQLAHISAESVPVVEGRFLCEADRSLVCPYGRVFQRFGGAQSGLQGFFRV